MKDLLLYIARNLVDDPDAVSVTEVQGEQELTLELRVAPDDMGKVIGRQGRIAAGCGLEVVDVNRLLKQFDMMQQMVKQMSKGGRMPGMPGMGGRMHGFGRKKRFK